jgi:hypothetical protein
MLLVAVRAVCLSPGAPGSIRSTAYAVRVHRRGPCFLTASWFGQNKDLLALVVAAVAVVVSLVTVLVQRRQQQLDAYRQIYDALMSPEIHRGRWSIIEVGRTGKSPEWDSGEQFNLFRTLGMLNALATYYRHRIVPRRLVRKVWKYPMMDMRVGVRIIRNAEIARIPESGRVIRPVGWEPWPDLWWLLGRLPREPISGLPAATAVERAVTADPASDGRAVSRADGSAGAGLGG